MPVLVALFAAIHLYRTPWSASDLEIVPDSVECAVAANRIATLGRYDFVIDGTAYPPRYPPGFSLLVLAPVYAIAPGEIGNGILAVLAFAVAAALAAYAIGRRLGGEWAGVGAAFALVLREPFGLHARLVMSDVPACALVLVCAHLFVRMERGARGRDWWVAGGIAAAAAAIRPLSAAAIVPFTVLAIRQRVHAGSKIPALAALAAPLALLAAATAIYNQLTFSDWLRSGYHYWCSVPCDDATLTFGVRYLRENLVRFTHVGTPVTIAAGIAGAALFWFRRSPDFAAIVRFALLAALPVTIVHLLYFFPSLRFHMAGLALLSILAGAAIGSLVPRAIAKRGWILAAGLAGSLLFARQPDPLPERRLNAETLALETPRDAVIVSGIDGAYLDYFVARGTERQIVPISRGEQYASKMIAPHRIARLDPPPRDARDHRAPGLLRAGAREVFEFTADERPDRIAELVRAGVPVYLDGSFVPKETRVESVVAPGLALRQVGEHSWLFRFEVAR